MIDTIILTLPRDRATMLDLTGRGVPSWDLQARTKTYEKYVKNASSKDEEGGLYFPRLTGFNRAMGKLAWQSSIKIEFSAPKLLYQNNLDELKESDFERVLETLDDRLKQMGVLLRMSTTKSCNSSKTSSIASTLKPKSTRKQTTTINSRYLASFPSVAVLAVSSLVLNLTRNAYF